MFSFSETSLSPIYESFTQNQPRNSSYYTSKIEQDILNSNKPIQINEHEHINVNGVSGIWANRNEVNDRDLSRYEINNDPNPIVIKKPSERIRHVQQIAVKFLKPPTVPVGDLIVRQEPDKQEPPAPPIIIRQEAKNVETPVAPIIIRESPPQMPCPIPEKIITIPGRIIPPPPRKIIIERLPEMPQKPPPIIIEKWLPYEQPTRRVIYEKICGDSKPYAKPKNIIINWEKPRIELENNFRNLGVFSADPNEYRQKYNFNKNISDLPSVVAEAQTKFKPPVTIKHNSNLPRLVGDLFALNYVDLDREGLGEYKYLINL